MKTFNLYHNSSADSELSNFLLQDQKMPETTWSDQGINKQSKLLSTESKNLYTKVELN